MERLNIDIDEVDQIFHIADIHIRTLKRHDEYREVFDRMYEKIKARKTENSLIAVLGDVVHAKTNLTPELVDMVSDFLRSLSDICPTILIPGNHDSNNKNPNRMDSLTPIVKIMDHPNLHYIKKSKVVQVGQVALSHFSQWDEEDKYPKASEISDDLTKVALFHGVVDKSETDTGWIMESDLDISMFKGYDISLLGDIHKSQFLDLHESILYSGSLIQQNHGEEIDGHGFWVWDMDDCSASFVPVENDYGFFTMRVKNAAVPLSDQVPKYPRLRLKISDTNSVETKRVVSDLRKFYDIDEISINRVDSNNLSTINPSTGEENKVGNIQDVEYQNTLIVDYLQSNYGIGDEIKSRVREINRDINQSVENWKTQNIEWKLKRFEFENMFSYGEDNVIDFQDMHGIVGLFAKNASGKSSILDAISFCLFDKCSRTYKASKVLNNRSDTFWCKATLDINNTTYVIERTGETSYGRVPVDVDFYKFDDNGDKVSLNGEQRRDTNSIIKNYIGDYEDFIMTALSTQGENTLFIEKSQADRKDLLSRFIGIDIFDDLYTKAKDESRDISVRLKDFDSRDLSKELADVESTYEESSKVYSDLKKRRNNIKQKRDNLSSELIELNKKLHEVPDENLDISKLNQKKSELTKKYKNVEEKKKHAEIKKREKEQPLQGYREILSDLNQSKIRETYSEWEDLQNMYYNKRNKKRRLENTLSDVEDSIDHINGHEFNPDCEYCVHRNQKDASKLEDLKEKQKNLQSKISDLSSWMKNNESEVMDDTPEREVNHLSKVFRKIEDLEEQVHHFKMKANNKRVEEKELESKISKVKDQIELYNRIKTELEDNEKTNKEIKKVKDELLNVEEKLDEIDDTIRNEHSNIKIAESKREDIYEDMNKYETLSKKYEAYEFYLDAIKRDGVPYDLIEKTMPRIEEEVNNILSNIVDFGVMMKLDGKNIDSYIVYDEENFWPLEMSSNFERFVSSLSIRVALINIANVPRPNFLAIDEGFSAADMSNLNSMGLLFDYMKDQFKFVIVISHVDMMRDMVNDLVEIQTEKEFSKVMYI